MAESISHGYYERWYFEKKYAYTRKRAPVQRHYAWILQWADRAGQFAVLRGRGKFALDVGCAYGYVVEFLSRLGYHAFGTDISKFALNQANTLGYRDLCLSSAERLPFRRNLFDLVTCFEVLEHLNEPERTISEICDILKPKGVLIITTPIVTPSGYLIPLLAKEKLSSHPSMKQPQAWTNILRKTGFDTIKFETFLIIPIPPTLFGRYFTAKCGAPVASHVRMMATKA